MEKMTPEAKRIRKIYKYPNTKLFFWYDDAVGIFDCNSSES